VHQRRTKFARRVSHAANVIERRGVRATYALHDRLLANRAARRKYGRDGGSLDDTQAALLERLRRDGFATIPMVELVGDERWTELSTAAEAFVAETEEGLRREAAGEESGLRRTAAKDFVVRKNAWGVELGADDPWLRVGLEPAFLDLANAYLGLWAKLEYVDLWYTPPTAVEDRRASQRWHRDFNDRHLLKGFLYLLDVDAEAGPFEYVPGSFPGGPLGDLWPWAPGGKEAYPPQEEFDRRLADARIETFAAPRGTLILCNTAGFHRGGFARSRPRALATWTFASPAALKALSERNYAFTGDRAALPAAARFAVS
jgi:hypothetical protein